MATIVNNANQIEIVRVNSVAGDTFTVVRGQEGTTARALAAGEKIENRLTAGALKAVKDQPADPTQIPDGSLTGRMIAANTITSGKYALGSVGAAALADGNVTPVKLAAGAALANLGFTPVNQGGGIGQLSDNVFIGWTNRNILGVTVGVTNLGYLLTERQDGSAESAGYRALWPNTQNNDYVFGLVDNGRAVLHTAGIHTYTVPAEATPFNQGGVVHIVNAPGAGVVTIAPAPGVLLTAVPGGATGARTLASPGVATVEKIGGNNWLIYGAGLT
jgi:hypothetical protein